MVLFQRNIIVIILSVIVIYVLIYLGVLKLQWLNIRNLYSIKYLVIALLVSGLVAISLVLWKKVSVLSFFYLLMVSFLILFFVSSIFVFKIEDLFFWNEHQKKSRRFLHFSYWMLGTNYILSLPYFIFFVAEIVFFVKKLYGKK